MDSQDYLVVSVEAATEELAEIFEANLAELAFDSFVYESQELMAYVQASDFDESALKAVLADTADMMGIPPIAYRVEKMEAKNWNAEWEQTGFTPIHVGDITVAPYGADAAEAVASDASDAAGAAVSDAAASDGAGAVASDGAGAAAADAADAAGVAAVDVAAVDVAAVDVAAVDVAGSAAGGGITVWLDPQMAFGTGHHHTTYMMMETLLSLRDALPNASVMDLGCGTAVLAIVAAKLGANPVYGIDIDAVAARSAAANVALNGYDFPILCGDANDLRPAAYDFILANIHRNIIIADLHLYAAALRPGGHLLLSGFYEADAADILAAAEPFGFSLAARRVRDGWTCLDLVASRR